MKNFDDLPREYRGDGERSYITFSLPVDDDVKQYQIEMLQKNTVEILLPFSAQRVNDNWKLSYDITSRITLNRILERRLLSKEEFECLIVQFVKLIRELKDYLLDLSSVVLDSSSIFCDPSALSLYFLYMPVKIGEDDPVRLKTFLKKLIFEEIQLLDDASASLLKRLLEVLKSEAFSAEQLSRCIQDKGNRTQALRSDGCETAGNDHFSCDDETPAINNNIRVQKHIPPGKPNGEANHSSARVILPQHGGKKQDEKRFHQNGNDASGRGSSHLIAGAVNGILVGILIYILCSVKAGSGRLSSTIAGFMLIAAAINYFLFTRLLKHDKKTENQPKKKPQNQVSSGKHFMGGTLEEDIILPQIPKTGKKAFPDAQEFSPQNRKLTNEAEGPENEPGGKTVGSKTPQILFAGSHEKTDMGISRHDSKPYYPDEGRTGGKLPGNSFQDEEIQVRHLTKTPRENDLTPPLLRNGSGDEMKKPFTWTQASSSERNSDARSKKPFVSDKTVVLGEVRDYTPYLQSISNPAGKIMLSKASVLLGRLEDSVDYVIPNRAVGKIHAEILNRADGFYIIDLNSVNGTYVNGERLVCNTEVMIKNGDNITLANESYTFTA